MIFKAKNRVKVLFWTKKVRVFFAKIVKDTNSSLVLMPWLVCPMQHWELGCLEDVSDLDEKIVLLELDKQIRTKKSQSLRSQPQ